MCHTVIAWPLILSTYLVYPHQVSRLIKLVRLSFGSRYSRAESEVVGSGRSDSANKISLWLDVCSSWEGLDFDTKELFLVI